MLIMGPLHDPGSNILVGGLYRDSIESLFKGDWAVYKGS